MNDESYLIGESRQMRDARDFCARFGPHVITVLVVGETGTGKSVVAAEVHRVSSRRQHPRVRISS